MQPHHRYFALVCAALLAWCAPHLAAQVTYTVFPVPTASSAGSEQPTKPSVTATRVTLIVHDSTVAYVVRELTRQAKLQVLYNASDSRFEKRVSVRAENIGVMSALVAALKGTGLVAMLESNGEVVTIHSRASLPDKARAPSTTGIITGRVVDSAKSQGLSGASIKVVGTKLSTVTSDSGNFTLRNVPVGEQVLSVKLFGYKLVERTVTVVDSQPTFVRITLSSVPTVLSGVVTTATGRQQRIEVGNDITVLNADSIQNVAPVSTLTDMLATRVPGLVVQNSSGIPGAPARLRLRGISSINSSNDPIVIVDGIRVYANQSGTRSAQSTDNNFTSGGSTIGGGTATYIINSPIGGSSSQYAGPSALDQIDPNSIETIEVLKGPSATAIYGSDAGSGVIVITTKHGHVGPTQWSFSLDEGRTTLPSQWPVNWYAFGSTYSPPLSKPCNSATGYPGNDPTRCRDSLVSFQALNDPRYSPLTGQAGHNSDVSFTVFGGSGTLTYAVTGTASTKSGYLHLPSIEQERFQLFHGFPVPGWMITPDQYATWGGSGQMTAVLGKSGAVVSLTSSLFHSAQQQSSLQNDVAPLSAMFVDTTQLAAQPLFPDYYTRVQFGTETVNNAVTLNNWAPWSWLPVHATLGLNVGSLNNTSLLPRDYITCLGNTYDDHCGQDSVGEFDFGQGTNRVESLTAGTMLGTRRFVSTAVGFNVYTTTQTSISEKQVGLPIGVTIPDGFNNPLGMSPFQSTSVSTYGWYIAPTVNFLSQLFVSPGFRLDGGSASGTSSQLNLFPKVDVSYIAVNRSTDPLFGVLTLVRPRIAFGIAGVQPGPGQQLRLLELSQKQPLSATGLGTPNDVLFLNSLGNPNLHPERDQELEGGGDLTLWDQRVTLTITGYRKTAYDAILDVPIAPSVYGKGYSQSRNIGTIRNTGLEVQWGARLLDNRALAWTVNANVAKNHNVVVSLVPGQPPIVELGGGNGYQTRLTPGYPVNGIWAQPIASYVDANHDGLIQPGEVVLGDSATYLGAPIANYEATLSTTITLFNGRVTFNTSVDYQNGLTQVDETGNQFGQLLSPSETPAQQAALAARVNVGGTTAYGTAIGFVQTVNILRWNTVSLNVLVPSSVSRLVRVPAMSVALQGSNLGMHTNYKGADPNVNAYSSGNLTADVGQLPQPRVWSLRVSLGN